MTPEPPALFGVRVALAGAAPVPLDVLQAGGQHHVESDPREVRPLALGRAADAQGGLTGGEDGPSVSAGESDGEHGWGDAGLDGDGHARRPLIADLHAVDSVLHEVQAFAAPGLAEAFAPEAVV